MLFFGIRDARHGITPFNLEQTMDDERRRAKEAWVTGHSGGPMLEVAVISAVSVVRFALQFVPLCQGSYGLNRFLGRPDTSYINPC